MLHPSEHLWRQPKISGRVLPVGERLDSCLKFVERAKGRVQRQQRVVEEAKELLTQLESQLAAGFQDLERLRTEARSGQESAPAPPQNEDSWRNTAELWDLRREVEQLRRERDVWLAKPNPQPMEGVAGDFRSSRMAVLIDEADAKRRCLDSMAP